jgi:hypothetical protein
LVERCDRTARILDDTEADAGEAARFQNDLSALFDANAGAFLDVLDDDVDEPPGRTVAPRLV